MSFDKEQAPGMNRKMSLFYKTQLCDAFQIYGSCRLASNCTFAHGIGELRALTILPDAVSSPKHGHRYGKKNKIVCSQFKNNGTCRFGDKCRYIHDRSESKENQIGYDFDVSQSHQSRTSTWENAVNHTSQKWCKLKTTATGDHPRHPILETSSETKRIKGLRPKGSRTQNKRSSSLKEVAFDDESLAFKSDRIRSYSVQDMSSSQSEYPSSKTEYRPDSKKFHTTFSNNTDIDDSMGSPEYVSLAYLPPSVVAPVVPGVKYNLMAKPLLVSGPPQVVSGHQSNLTDGEDVRLNYLNNLHQPYTSWTTLSSAYGVAPTYYMGTSDAGGIANQYYVPQDISQWLSAEIQEYLSGIQEKMKSLKRAQDRMVRKVNAATRLALQNTRLEVYGSTTTGLALPSSDIDCVLVPIVEEESPANHELQEVLESLKKIQAQVLAQASDCAYDFHLIDTAKIPILKFTMRASSWKTRFDVTCSKSSEHSGIRTREMVLSFMGVMPAIRPLVLILKSQLVSQGLNDPYTGGLSSYALLLLVVSFLQACGLNHIEVCISNNQEEPLEGQSLTSIEKHTYCFQQHDGSLWYADIGTLLIQFLKYYLAFDFVTYGISVENGGSIYLLNPIKHNTYIGTSAWIDDPIRPDRNVAKTYRLYQILETWRIFLDGLLEQTSLRELLRKDDS